MRIRKSQNIAGNFQNCMLATTTCSQKWNTLLASKFDSNKCPRQALVGAGGCAPESVKARQVDLASFQLFGGKPRHIGLDTYALPRMIECWLHLQMTLVIRLIFANNA